MGIIIKGYLCCAVCCSTCFVVGSIVLLTLAEQCLSEEGPGACSRAGGIVMLVLGALPPSAALWAVLYLQADARGWCRPGYVKPGGHGRRRKSRFPEEELMMGDEQSAHAPAGHLPQPVQL
jgi:hypothetical protein